MNPRYITASRNDMDMLIWVRPPLRKVGKPGVSGPRHAQVVVADNYPSVIRKLQIELRWIGKLPGRPYRVKLPGGQKSVFKIKVDEKAGYVINTFTDGGLVVSDIHDHRVLWALDEVLIHSLVVPDFLPIV